MTQKDKKPIPPPKSDFGSRPLAALSKLAGSLPSLPSAAAGQGVPSPAGAQADAAFAKALSKRIVIQRDSRGRGGKTVTFARGIEAPEAVLERLAKELRHELGTGVRVEDGALIVQGALSERLAACLQRRGATRIVLGN